MVIYIGKKVPIKHKKEAGSLFLLIIIPIMGTRVVKKKGP